MTEKGTVIDGKFEVLKQIGRGGMSIVYLAMDKHLNKQWAIKEIRKKGNSRADAMVASSLIKEANLMKKLDHPAFPRIVDIIDTGATSYVIMDYIEGETLGNILNTYGPQPEEKVISWAKQVCEALKYLHSRKPPIIYRDIKPANLMLKPDGNTIKIIDFGIALECTKENMENIEALGTPGYAPHEQKTNPCIQSDIYSLGMTMRNLLTGIAVKEDNPCIPVRQWNPDLSESIELIIEKCTHQDPADRYQNCDELLYDLKYPELLTKEFRTTQKRKLLSFCLSLGLAVALGISGMSCRYASIQANNDNYDLNVVSSDPDKIIAAVEIYPERVDAYDALIDFYKNRDPSNEEITRVGNIIEAHGDSLYMKNLERQKNPEIAEMFYNMGKLYFADYDGSFKERAINSKKFFEAAFKSGAYFEKKNIAECYYSICRFMTNQSTTSEHTKEDYDNLFQEIRRAMDTVEHSDGNEANYDRISLYYITMLLINDQAEYMAGVGIDRTVALNLMDELKRSADGITSTLSYVNHLRDEMKDGYDAFVMNINAKYNEVEKRQMGGE